MSRRVVIVDDKLPMAETLADGTHDTSSVEEVVERPDPVHTTQRLETALDALESTSASAVPVLDPESKRVVGWLTSQRVLTALRTA